MFDSYGILEDADFSEADSEHLLQLFHLLLKPKLSASFVKILGYGE